MAYNVTIYIDNPYNDYEFLNQQFNNNDIVLSYDHDYNDQLYGVVFSPHIESLDSIEAILKRLFSMQILLNGARFIILKHETHRRIEFDRFEIINHPILENQIVNIYADSIEEYPFEGNEDNNLASPGFIFPCDLDSLLFTASKIDHVIRALLFQAGMIRTYNTFDKILTWNTLYKIVDTVKYGCHEIGITVNSLIDEDSLERFTSACNNALVLGINARHGLKDKKTPKKQPLTDIEEAVNLILCLAHRFAVQYVQTKSWAKVEKANTKKCTYIGIK